MSLARIREQATIPYKTGYHAFDAYAMTSEEGDFLYALTRMIRPALVVETGTGTGISGAFIAEALRDNGTGQLVTYEEDRNCAALAKNRLTGLPATVLVGDCRKHSPNWNGFIHIDSHPGRRTDDITHWLSNGFTGLVVVHDADREYKEFRLGQGVIVPGPDSFWIGRGR